MDRRNDSAHLLRIDSWRRSARSAVAGLADPDARWALVSTSVTALVAGAVAWLAAGVVQPGTQQNASRDHGLMPYQLFLQLASKAGDTSHASLAPTMPGERDGRSVAGSSYSFDGALSAEEAGASAAPAGIETHTVTLDSGDTLMGALTNAGLSAGEAQSVISELAKVYDPRSIHTGQSFDLTFAAAPPPPAASVTITLPNDGVSDAGAAVDEANAEPVQDTQGRLLSLAFSPSVERDITVTRTASGTFVVNDAQKVLHAQLHRAGAKIDSSLYLSAMKAGIPAEVVVEMIRMFSYEVDFQRDLQPGDSFEVLYNYYYTPDGQPAKQGDISYAAIHLGNRSVAMYRYQPKNGDPAEYFDSQGRSAKSMLMKTPVDGARISSGFGMRFHPVLGYSRMHKGIDFAVPIGTPVMAAGSGTVQIEGRVRGYGNFMMVNHGNGYSTAYGHLSRFAAGIHKGSRVRQGQVIAYSGNTGMTTGPHLHYEIRVHNQQVNPRNVKIASGRKLGGSELKTFMAQRVTIDKEIAGLPLETKVADATGDLRSAD